MPIDSARMITQAEFDAIWEEAHECDEAVWQSNDIERQQDLPKRLGQGSSRVIELQPGLTIRVDTSLYWRPLCKDYRFVQDGVLLSNFYLAGDRHMINPGIQLEEDREETAGETCLCYISEARSIEYFPDGQLLKSVGINTDLERLRSFGMNWNDAPFLVRSLVEGNAKNFHQSLNRTTPAMQQILRQILDCPYHGAIKRIYLESKVLELLALQFHQLAVQNSCTAIPNFRPTDIERLHRAREILQRDLNYPPSLLDLARQVGLNDYKLKRGFRYLFGTTVFGYLQRCRMEQAQQLLGDRELSIAEVAHRVGYASASRFCDAFKRHMGMTPSDYRR